jgi:hypothetical protein
MAKDNTMLQAIGEIEILDWKGTRQKKGVRIIQNAPNTTMRHNHTPLSMAKKQLVRAKAERGEGEEPRSVYIFSLLLFTSYNEDKLGFLVGHPKLPFLSQHHRTETEQ